MQKACVPRNQPGKEREGEGERKKEKKRKNTGWPSFFGKWGPLFYFQKGLLFLNLYIENNGRCKSCRVSSPDSYRDQAFFLHSFWYTKFSGDLHHLLAKRPANILWPFLMMISQSENLFSPEVIFLKSGTTLRRHQIKLHSYRAKV